MSRSIEEIQNDIRTLTRVPSLFIDQKLNELADEVGNIRADAIDECIAKITELNSNGNEVWWHTMCNILEQLKEKE